MKNMKELITRLEEKKIYLSLENDSIRVKSDNNIITDDVIILIRENKDDLIVYLKKEKNDYEIENIYPLSPMQEGMLFHALYSTGSEVYITQVSLDFVGEINISSFSEAWQAVTNRHTILRTSFVSGNVSKPLQRVHKYVRCNVEYSDFTEYREEEIPKRLDVLSEKDRIEGFELMKAPLSKFKLVKLSENKHRFIWTHHHILIDGWCLPILFKEFYENYQALSEGKEINVREIDKYEDFIYYLQEQDKGKAEAFWKDYLKGFTTPTPIPIGNTNQKADENDTYQLKGIILNKEETRSLNEFSKKHHLTVNTLVQSAWSLLLSRYSGENDIVFGMTVSGRPAVLPGVEEKVGLFINTLPLRTRVYEGQNIVEWLKEVQGQQPLLREYEYMPLVDIHSLSEVPKGESLFNSILVFENYPIGESANAGNSSLQIENVQFVEKTNYPLSILVSVGNNLAINISFNSRIYSTEIIGQTLGHFREALLKIVNHAGRTISAIDILTPAEKQKLLFDWNDTHASYPSNKCIHELFEAQVEKTPDNIAAVYGEKQLSYKELNEKSNQLAYYLQEKGVKPDALVGICVDRSLEMIIGLLGILKSGGAYVPIDPTYPRERISYMLEDAASEIVLTQRHIELPETKSEIICLDTDWDKIGNVPSGNVKSAVTSDNLAYVIYTSGSTGKPKGVMNQHNGIVNRLYWTQDNFKLQQGDVILQKTTYSFDVSVWELFWPIVVGSKLVFAKPEGHKDNVYLIETIKKEQVTTIHFVPSMLSTMLDTEGIEECVSLKRVLCSGEALSYKLTEQFYEKMAHSTLHNLYGPTEAAVDVSYFPCEQYRSYSTIPIGKPVSNTALYILDKNGMLVPVGVPGELYIGGEQVARGYLKKPELTAERFIKDPFSEKPGSRLYKTGDLVRYLPDGNIEYIGRIDNQVKIRGFRIELGEIEAAINKIPTIKDSVVLAKADVSGNNRLVAYLVSEEELNVKEIREDLSKTLPDYMVPSLYVKLEEMPLTPNGKADRKALPEPEGNIETTNEYVAPRNETEKKIVEIWSELLGVEKGKIGINESFFSIGGDSIKAIRLLSQTNNLLKVKLRISDLYSFQTVGMLAGKIGSTEYNKNEIIEINKVKEDLEGLKNRIINEGKIVDKDNIEDIYPMSDIERGMLYSSLKEAGSGMYHDQFVYPRWFTNFNYDRFKKALSLVVDKHHNLRSSYNMNDYEESVKIVYKEIELDIEEIDISTKDEESQKQHITRYLEEDRKNPFNFLEAPLWRMRVFKINTDQVIITWSFHHSILDGWSNASLMTEINNTYIKLETQEDFKPKKLQSSYKDYIIDAKFAEKNKEAQEYWKNRLLDYKRVVFPPVPRDVTGEGSLKVIRHDLGTKLLKDLENIATRYNTSIKHLCFAAYTYMINMLSYENDIVVGLVTNNRPVIEDGDKIIGCFLNTVPFRVKIPKGISWKQYINETEKNLVELKKYDKLSLLTIKNIVSEQSRDENPFFDTLFNYVDFHIYNEVQVENVDESRDSIKNGTLEIDGYENTNTLFDFTVSNTTGIFSLHLSYSNKFITGEDVQKLTEYFIRILNNFIEVSNDNIDKNGIVLDSEKQKLLFDWNDTHAGYPNNKCIHEIFEAQVEKTPDNIASVYGEKQLSYKELNEKSNQLAYYLQEKGVKPDALVGICVDRSLEMIIGLLGILKAGGAYVPIDPTYPRERISYMLEDAASEIVLTQRHIELPETKSEIICLDTDWDKIGKFPSGNVKSAVTSDNLAYVIYTSGSTGKPKGTLIEHMNVVRLLFNDKFQFNFSEKDVWSLFHSFCFDFSVWEMYGALLYGGKLIIIPKEATRDTEEFSEILEKHKVTVLNQTPSVFYNLSDVVERNKTALAVRYVIFGAEALKPSKLRYWYEKYPTCKLINMYGITETTVHVTYKEVTSHEIENNICNIGKPIPTLSTYILDKNQNLQPVGVPGELCVSGAGLSRGYLNNEKLTAAKFRNNPFAEGEKIYHSGDLAYINETGELIYCGRIDNQIKIRGFRIELGEVEAAINKIEKIKDCVVVARDGSDGNKQLVAYFISSEELNVQELRKELSKSLPEYMIPSIFVKLDNMPLTSNGKVDRKALPEPEGNIETTNEYVAPRNETEKKIVELWSELLGVEKEKIGINESFFSIGGDSIKAIRMLNQTNNLLNTKLKISDIYSFQTVGLLAKKIKEPINDKNEQIEIAIIKDEIEGLKNRIINEGNIIDKNNIDDIYPMSDIEKGMIYSSLMETDSGIYHDQFVYPRWFTNFNYDRFKKALSLVVDKHQNLRSSYNMNDYEESVKIIYKEIEIDIKEIDLSTKDEESQKIYITGFLEDDRRNPFNFIAAPLWRMRVFKINTNHVIITWSFHHSILDGWSNASLMTEINNTYIKLETQENFIPKNLKSSYKDYIIDAKFAEKNKEAQEYWKNKLSDYKRVVFPPVPKYKSVEDSLKIIYHNLGNKMLKDLENIATRYHTSVKHLCFTAYTCMINMLSYENDIVVGFVTNNRPVIEDGDKIIGCFLNTVPYRVTIPQGIRWKEYINETEKNLVELKKYDKLSLLKIKKIVADQSRDENPFFDTLFNFVDFHIYNEAQTEGLEMVSGSTTNGSLQIDGFENTNTLFDFIVSNTSGIFSFQLSYSNKFITEDNAHKLTEYFIRILNNIIEETGEIINKDRIILESEKQKLLVDWNDTAADYPKDKCIHEIFEEQVEKTPDNIAIVFEDKKLTYRNLNKKANIVAHYLKDNCNIKSGDLIGIHLDRSENMIISILAILKAGCAYVPIDSEYPEARINYIIKNSQLKTIISDKNENDQININEALASGGIEINPEILINTETPIYIIYTSGSTGKPKGTVITHRNFLNYISWAKEYYFENEETGNFGLFTSISFDLTTTCIFLSLLRGKTLEVFKQKDELSEILIKIFQSKLIDSVKLTPSHISLLAELDLQNTQINLAIVGGEELRNEQVRVLKVLNKNMRIENEYGPTEATVGCIVKEIKHAEEQITIGKPINNTQIYILDKNQKICPIGISGELCISGASLSQGYLHWSELTAEKFIKNPFSDDPGSRLYKTGDLARYLPDGNIEFIGRIDNQVKIRGYRIELGEVETIINKVESIKDCVVMAKGDSNGNKRLVAYLVSGEDINIQDLREELSKKLPDYMVPSLFVRLDEIPLTPNGKVNRKALPEPEGNIETTHEYVAPQTETEQKLATIWCKVLGTEKVGIYDNFFELGGDSIITTQIASRANQENIFITPRDIFKHQTIASLAKVSKTKDLNIIAEQGLVSGEVPLTPIQSWFFEEDFENKNHWNQAVMLKVKDTVDISILENAINALVQQHDVLRLSYINEKGQWVQKHNELLEHKLEVVDYSHLSGEEQSKSIEEHASRIQGSLSIENGMVFKTILYKTKSHHELLIAINHLVVDGVSWRTLIEDIQKACLQQISKKEIDLGLKTSSFKQWSERLTEYAGSEKLSKEIEYWKNILSQPDTTLPLDYKGENTGTSAKNVIVKLTKKLTGQLLKEAGQAYKTEINDLLLTSLAISLEKWTRNNNVIINLEGHGREDLFKDTDITRTVGWFTTQFPVCLTLEKENNIADAIKSIKEQLRGIPNKGIGYGILRYLHPEESVRKGLSLRNNNEISFNYLGQFDNIQENNDLITMSGQPVGVTVSKANHRAHIIDINSLISNGELVLSWTYSENLHKKETIEKLAYNYVEELQHIVEHCLKPESKGYTPSDFPLCKITQKELDNYVLSGTEIDNLESVYPLSPMQEGMLFHSLYSTGSEVYMTQLNLGFEGQLNPSAFRDAWQGVIDKHTILRTSFVISTVTRPLQRVHKFVECNIEQIDFTEFREEEIPKKIDVLSENDRIGGFDLTKAPLSKFKLVKLSENKHRFIWTHHHILLDGWCLPIIFKEFYENYHTICKGEEIKIKNIDKYEDFINYLQEQDNAKAEEFWKDYLKGFETPTPIPIGNSNQKADETDIYKQKSITLNIEETGLLNDFSKKHHLTVNTLVQSAWSLLLSRYSGEKDVLFGMTVSGRPVVLSGVEEKVGLFINTLPLRIKIDGDQNIVEWLKEIQERQPLLREFEYMPLLKIQSLSEVPKGENLFNSILIFENYPIGESVNERNSTLQIENIQAVEKTNYQLSISASMGIDLTINISFNNKIFKEEIIGQVLAHFREALLNIIKHAGKPLSEIEILTQSEKHKMLFEWNDTQIDYPKEKCIHELFEQQVVKTPNKIAAEFEGQQITFKELNEKSNQLAYYLQEKGVKPESLVGICVDRSLEMMIGLLGILKAGGAYVPIDPTYPRDRISYMLEDACCEIVLTQSHLELPETNSEIVYLDTVWEKIKINPINNIQSGVKSNNLVYVIYTSGSTGKPKGVMIEHGNLVNFLLSIGKYPGITSKDRLISLTSISFDIHTLELYLPLITGAYLSLVSSTISHSAELLAKAINEQSITIAQATPATWKMLSGNGWQPANSLKILCGGEAIDDQLKQELLAYPSITLYNMYGPTETTVWSSTTELIKDKNITIGAPIANTQFYITDKQNNIVPIGVPGELLIGGDGLARGYLKQPELTAEKFVKNQFIDDPDSKLYKTGDLVRYLPDGNIEFIGRMDDQVKIRGFRIELGEIESVLLENEKIKEAVVVVNQRNMDDKRLIAFIVPVNGSIGTFEFKKHLRNRLPNYMIPSIVVIEEIPLTTNGKINKRALLQNLSPDSNNDNRKYVEPKTDVEKQVAEVWKELFGVEKVGLNDTFFDLGGNSLLLINNNQKIKNMFDVELSLNVYFNQTLEHIASAISQKINENVCHRSK